MLYESSRHCCCCWWRWRWRRWRWWWNIESVTSASVGESRTVRTEQLILLEVYRWTCSTRLSPADMHRFHVVYHTTASRPADWDSGRIETAVVTYVSVTQSLASIWPAQHSTTQWINIISHWSTPLLYQLYCRHCRNSQLSNLFSVQYTLFHKIGTPLFSFYNFSKCWSILMKIISLCSLRIFLMAKVFYLLNYKRGHAARMGDAIV